MGANYSGKGSNKIAEKRIPVSEEVWKELHGMRKPGQTYDSLLREMIPVYEHRAVPDYGEVIILEPVEKKTEKLWVDKSHDKEETDIA